MKKLFTIISCCIFAASVQAQIVSSHSRSITTETSDYPDYNRLEISYSPMTMKYDGESENFTGIKLGYLHGMSISKTMPLYLEYGINAMYAWYSDSEENGGYEEEVTASVLNLNVPVNIAYKYAINQDMHVTPYAGLHLRGNIMGKSEWKESYRSSSKSETIDFFDKDDVKHTANRIQIGGQIGVGLDYKQLYFGVAYNTQFGEYRDDVTTSGFDVTVGFNF